MSPLFPPDVASIFVFTQADESGVPKVIVARLFKELELSTSTGLSQRQSSIFAFVKPWPLTLRFRQIRERTFGDFERTNFLDNCSRTAGVKPFRVRAA